MGWAAMAIRRSATTIDLINGICSKGRIITKFGATSRRDVGTIATISRTESRWNKMVRQLILSLAAGVPYREAWSIASSKHHSDDDVQYWRPDNDSDTEYKPAGYFNESGNAETPIGPKRWAKDDSRLGKPEEPGLQIFSVKVTEVNSTNVDDNGRVGIYGIITMKDGLDHYHHNYIYKRERDNCEYVKPQDIIRLISPRRGSFAYQESTVEFNLNIVGKESFEDKPLCKGHITHNSIFYDDSCDMFHRVKLIRGKCGAVEVDYAMFMSAVEATIEIEGGTNCRGLLRRLDAYIFYNEDNFLVKRIPLFDSNLDNEGIIVGADGMVGLWSYVLTIPSEGFLSIDMDICSQEGNNTNNKFSFAAKLYGEEVKKFGDISFRISWSLIVW